ncbi:hypothetical protein, partial [Vibrio sp. F74]|uniref:hypothetical protein n=2 Tax=Vibrio sp. F74 TaxID=700020 RepID=UPI0035F547DC
SITQHQAIEQVNGDGDINELTIGVDVTDTDGDTVPNAANINITIADGALATATDSNVTFTETQGVQTITGGDLTVAVVQGSDDV